MKLSELLNKSEKTLFSFEILPPLKGSSIDSLYQSIDPLLEFDPAFINVTYHREEYIYKKREEGYLEKVAIKKRPGTVGICAAIQNKYKIPAIPHLICGGFSIEETENALVDLSFLGIDNVLALRGDARKTEKEFVPEKGGHHFAIDLVKQVKNMNSGIFTDKEVEDPSPSDFCIGVAGYPEKHMDAPNLKADLKHLKAKVDAGAEYIITQMFFDNKKFFAFVEACREMGITVPIIPGLKPIQTLKQITILPQIFAIDLPEELMDELDKCKDNKDVRQVGIDWCIKQSKELMEYGVPSLHYYTMSRSKAVSKIATAVFKG